VSISIMYTIKMTSQLNIYIIFKMKYILKLTN